LIRGTQRALFHAALAGVTLAGCGAPGPQVPLGTASDSFSLSRVYSLQGQPQIIVKHEIPGDGHPGISTKPFLKWVHYDAATGLEIDAVTGGDYRRILKDLRRTPGIAYAEPNFRISLPRAPQWEGDRGAHEPNFPGVFAPQLIRSLEANQKTTGTGQVIAIVDTGVDLTHPDFAGKLVSGINLVDSTQPPADDHGHGTNCAGIAASLPDSTNGIVGVAPGAQIMPVKVMGADGEGSDATIAAGIRWAADHGATVINLSLASPESSQTCQEAIQYALDKGVVLVAAMGNGGNNKKSYPAAYPGVIAVAASDVNDAHPSFSQSGPWCSVTAPGYSILSTFPTYQVTSIDDYLKNKSFCEKLGVRMGLKYAYVTGTSQATPHVAGLAALVKALDPSLGPNDVKRRIEKSADDVPEMFGSTYDSRFGYGRINAMRAL